MADRDELSWWDELSPPFAERDERDPPSFSAYEHVRSLFRHPFLGEYAPPAPPPAPTLRSAAAEKLRSAGLVDETPAADGSSTATTSSEADGMHPPSWKLPSRRAPPIILGDRTAAGLERGAVSNVGPAPSARDPLAVSQPTPTRDDASPAAAPSAALRESAARGTASLLDRPDAQAGLALTAADTLLTKGIDLAVNLAGGNAAVARKLIELGANALAGVLPQEFRASALTSASAAAAEAERRIGDNERATRTRAALGTLANRRAEAEHEHAAAVVAGDRTKTEAARREAIEAWSAERRARGDGEAEINAGARAVERDYRKVALRHRLAQLDEAGITRALDQDEDAKADPGMAREVAADIRILRRDDPARAGEASIEREIAARKRDGRIDTPEEEAAARYKLRLDAQARRGIPEHQRRLLTNAERVALATEYLRIESGQGKGAADKWLEDRAQETGAHAERFKNELTARPEAEVLAGPAQSGARGSPGDGETTDSGGATQARAPAQPSRNVEAPGTVDDSDNGPLPVAKPPHDRDAPGLKERAQRYRAAVREHLRELARRAGVDADALIGDILSAARTASAEQWSPAQRYQQFLALRERIDAAVSGPGDNRLRVYLLRGAKAALEATGSDGGFEDAFIRGVSGVSPGERAAAEIAKDEERERRDRQRKAGERYEDFKRKRPLAGYADTLAMIVGIARETGAVPEGALYRLMPDLSPSKQAPGRLADPEKVLAQLEALRAIRESGRPADTLPKPLRDLADDYDAVIRDPNRPRDPQQLVQTILRHGVPRQARELGEMAETAAEILTPWGSVVSLDDARKSAQQAYDAFAVGRTREGLEQSGDALWYLAMAAPILGNARRGAKAARGKAERAATLKQNVYNSKISERLAEAAVAEAFKDYRVIIKTQRLEKTTKGGTRPDIRIARDDADERLFSIEVKDGDARQKTSQRERQAILGKTHLMRVYRAGNRMTIDGIPAQEWFAAMRRKLDQMGLRKE